MPTWTVAAAGLGNRGHLTPFGCTGAFFLHTTRWQPTGKEGRCSDAGSDFAAVLPIVATLVSIPMDASAQAADGTVHLDLSAAYNHNGLAEYVTEGGLRELSGGGWVADPAASNANLITYRVGISFALGRSQ